MTLLLAAAAALLLHSGQPAPACDVPLLALTIDEAHGGLQAVRASSSPSRAAPHAREASDALGHAAILAISCSCRQAAVSFAKAAYSARDLLAPQDRDAFGRRLGHALSDFDRALADTRSCQPRTDEDAAAIGKIRHYGGA